MHWIAVTGKRADRQTGGLEGLLKFFQRLGGGKQPFRRDMRLAGESAAAGLYLLNPHFPKCF